MARACRRSIPTARSTVGLLLRSASGDGQAAPGAQAGLDQLDATIGDIHHFAYQRRGRPDPAEGSPGDGTGSPFR
jgi:hypothetical protein